MFVVGLTGGIGSGKSTVSDQFKVLGANIIDTDVIAKDITQPGQPAFNAISKRFDNILTESGEIDRRKLKRLIFSDATQKRWLEELLHPLIRKETQNQIDHSTAAYSIVVIPLLVETHSENRFNRILVIDTPVENQIERIIHRDNLTNEQAKSIIFKQASRQARINIADDIIDNSNDINSLTDQITALHHIYLEEAKNL